MKKLLGVIGVLALAAVLLPVYAQADLRGSFAPLTNISGFVNGCEQAAFRPIDAGGVMSIRNNPTYFYCLGPFDGGRDMEEWFAFSTRSLTPGREQVRSIWLHVNYQQAGQCSPDYTASFAPLLNDPSANISYFDPAWSSDGRFLAYVQSNADGSNQKLYVQEYYVNDYFNETHVNPNLELAPDAPLGYPVGQGAEDPVGDPILVVGSGSPRHPNWSPSGHTLAYDSNVLGSADLYTIDVNIQLGIVSEPTRRTFVGNKSESDPSWSPKTSLNSPNGHEIAYATNKFGPNIIETIDLDFPSAAPKSAEFNFNFVSHNNPDWTSDGGSIFYDAPSGEDPNSVTGIWRLNLSSQAKCEIQLDSRSDGDPNVSSVLQNTHNGFTDGTPYNYFLFTSLANSAGLQSWRGNEINSCQQPLAMGVRTTPNTLDINNTTLTTFTTTMSFPPATKALGYVCRSGNVGGEGVRLRNNIFSSPVLIGLSSPPGGGVGGTSCRDAVETVSVGPPLVTQRVIICEWNRRTIQARMLALGLVDAISPMKMTAYSNQTGRPFQGFAYIKFTKSSLSGSSVALLGNSPNPFNPVTMVKFAITNAGNYSLRVYNVQGALVRTLANQRYEPGTHEVAWDGRTTSGGKAASGVYFAKLASQNPNDSSSDARRMVLTK